MFSSEMRWSSTTVKPSLLNSLQYHVLQIVCGGKSFVVYMD